MSFVARFWLETGTNGDPIWRGHIRHVHSHKESYFQDLGIMNEFLAQISETPGFQLTTRLLDNADAPKAG